MRKLSLIGLVWLWVYPLPLLAEDLTPSPNQPITWTPLFDGIDETKFQCKVPRLLSAVAVKIDLKNPGIRFLATPGNGDQEGETTGKKTSTFLSENKLQVAINAAPFGPIWKDEGKAQDVAGVQVSQGKLISEPTKNYPALMLTKKNQATIVSKDFDFSGIENAVGGFHVVLKAGKVIEGTKDLHPRTAAGIADNGQTLVLLVVDGRQKDFSLGVTTQEVGQLLLQLGCTEGINLDGGGTSTLVILGADGKPAIRNRPIHANKPGSERVSASHLGVYAHPLTTK